MITHERPGRASAWNCARFLKMGTPQAIVDPSGNVTRTLSQFVSPLFDIWENVAFKWELAGKCFLRSRGTGAEGEILGGIRGVDPFVEAGTSFSSAEIGRDGLTRDSFIGRSFGEYSLGEVSGELGVVDSSAGTCTSFSSAETGRDGPPGRSSTCACGCCAQIRPSPFSTSSISIFSPMEGAGQVSASSRGKRGPEDNCRKTSLLIKRGQATTCVTPARNRSFLAMAVAKRALHFRPATKAVP